MWIKICGMTTAAAVSAAIEAEVDAIGFVFAESVRQVTPRAAAALARAARKRVRCVAVTRHPTQRAVDEIVNTFRPDLLQTDAADFAVLRLPTVLGRLPVVRASDTGPAVLPPRLLFEGPVSGSGSMSNWQEASALARRTELVLAGGLNSGNVAAAIDAVHPFGVDVSSGVEERPGVKSPEKILKFVLAVRAAGMVPPAAIATGDSR
jgi:phosphoribosylanthranilate isomerase